MSAAPILVYLERAHAPPPAEGTERHAGRPLAVYVHVPFCKRKCHYCDFASGPAADDLHEAYTRAVCREILASPWRGTPARTVFFGGGTPSEISLCRLGRIVAALRQAFPPAEGEEEPEWTIECNPGTLTTGTFPALLALGFNRVSLGIQSFRDRHLRALNRIHNAAEARAAIQWAREAGVRRLNLDLIFGLPDQTPAEWESDLAEAVASRPEHLSLYGLTIEPGTEFGYRAARGELDLPDDEASAWMYERALDECEAAGLIQYEISNFARPGEECRHNQVYWRREPSLGFGPSAASFWGGRRWSNVRSLSRYVQSLDGSVEPAVEHEEVLEGRRAAGEAIMLGLRTREGADLARICREEGLDAGEGFAATVESLVREGLLRREGPVIFLTRQGLLFANRVCAEFL